ncbi:RNA-binding protein Csx1 [Mycena floridula]|nr:RNA-binding protein Csx1 [Mycena floridula]
MSRTDLFDQDYQGSWGYARNGDGQPSGNVDRRASSLSYWGPNRHNSDTPPFSFSNHHHRPEISPPNSLVSSIFRQQPSPPIPSSRSTLWWGELEPWMDEEYAKQVCALMGWDPVNIRVPHPAPDPATSQQPNNPGYCFLTFPSPAHAAAILAQVNNGSSSIPMPNSTKPFSLNWASAVPTPTSAPIALAIPNNVQQYPKEYSIFVGDLAPETSNSDLVAVFRNPVLGLRNDREPKFIRPFLSCKSAKIMLDPMTGVSRGYGFVRFADEGDQQRALIEMHGLYCLSRPMRISPATAKFKPPQTVTPIPEAQPIAVSFAPPPAAKSVSAPIAATTSGSSLSSMSSGSHSSLTASSSGNTLSSTSTSTSSFSADDMLSLPTNVLAQLAQKYAGEANQTKTSDIPSITSRFVQPEAAKPTSDSQGGYMISEESWKHHAQARAILGNLIGPNGEQLTSTDPYNTTVFVGGLSPLISEETLRTFFVPFGEIHYVKVPIGKHCGFVQFVRKADAERAIEKMQGFPVGGSRIRLSWGRSQYKAAQAAAQAAQQAALQQFPPQPSSVSALNPEQAMQLLQKLAMQGYMNPASTPDGSNEHANLGYLNNAAASLFAEDKVRSAMLSSREDAVPPSMDGFSSTAGYAARNGDGPSQQNRSQTTFSPFSPDPNLYSAEKRRESYARSNEALPHPSKAYAPGFYQEDLKDNDGPRLSPTSTRPPSATKYSHYLGGSPPALQMNRAPGRPSELPISRPPSNGNRLDGPEKGQEMDLMHDLNGTLASLDLDRPWKSPSESTDSGASVQFRMSNSSP